MRKFVIGLVLMFAVFTFVGAMSEAAKGSASSTQEASLPKSADIR